MIIEIALILPSIGCQEAGAKIAYAVSKYIAINTINEIKCHLSILLVLKFLKKIIVNTAKIIKLKISDPRISPTTNSGELTIATADIAVNNSGREVTAAIMTHPIKAPLILVFLSSKSTKSASLIDKKTTKHSKITYKG